MHICTQAKIQAWLEHKKEQEQLSWDHALPPLPKVSQALLHSVEGGQSSEILEPELNSKPGERKVKQEWEGKVD